MFKRVRGVVTMTVALAALPSLSSGQQADRRADVILVSGATGTQGGAVARELTSRGYSVRGLTRNPDSDASRALSALGVQMVRGDFDDAASLDAALEGAYGAFSVQQYRGIGVEAEIRQSKTFADAARRAGVEHFIYSSVLFARLGTGVPQFESKREIEDYVRSLGFMNLSIIRPASFMTNLEGARKAANDGIYRTPFPRELARLHIAPRDIGRFVAVLFDDSRGGTSAIDDAGVSNSSIASELDIAGERISYADIAASMSRVMGKPVIYEQIPWEEYTATATPTAAARETWFIQNRVPLDLTGLRREFPWLTSLERYLIDAGWAER